MVFLELKTKTVLAPMAGITDLAFRLLCKRYGAGLVFTEMVSAEALLYNNKKTIELIKTTPEERPVVLQLFSSSAQNLRAAAAKFSGDFQAVDINMGCPVPKITKLNAGCMLMKDPKKVGFIVRAVKSAVTVPVTIKIRAGINNSLINFLEVAKAAEAAGVDAIIIHPRTMSQGFSGRADWSLIKKLKENLSVPVIGNGDVKNPDDYKRMLSETGCDYVMIGRAAIGNPFIFSECIKAEKGEPAVSVDRAEKLKAFYEYVELSRMYETSELNRIRIMAHYFTKGEPMSRDTRLRLNTAKTVDEIIKIVSSFLG